MVGMMQTLSCQEKEAGKGDCFLASAAVACGLYLRAPLLITQTSPRPKTARKRLVIAKAGVVGRKSSTS